MTTEAPAQPAALTVAEPDEWLKEAERLADRYAKCDGKDMPKNKAALLSHLRSHPAVADAQRFAWYFSDSPKGDFLMTYLDGMKQGWTADQWRAAIDAAMGAAPSAESEQPQSERVTPEMWQTAKNIRNAAEEVDARITEIDKKYGLDESEQPKQPQSEQPYLAVNTASAAPESQPQSAADAAPVGRPDLHAAIMNLPCEVPDTMNGSQAYDYKRGHRDARHAAAELVTTIRPDALIARQARQLEELRDEVADLKERATNARAHIFCIGGPLNDNKLGFSREQMGTFQRIAEELGE
jgi:hypothetical protein